MKSHLHHKVMGTRPFPSPGLSFPMSTVSRSALRLAMRMEISPFLHRTSTCVFWDQPTDLAERWLCSEGPGRRQGVLSGPRKEERRSRLQEQKQRWVGEPTGLRGDPVCVYLHAMETQQSVFHSPIHFLRY